MNTLDINTTHGLALVEDSEGSEPNTRYVPLATAPAQLAPEPRLLNQRHYIAGHVCIGLVVHDRIDEKGNKPPRDGWMRWHP